MTNKPTLVFMGPVGTRSGYGDHARDLVRGLIYSDKYDVKIISTRWGGCPMNALNDANEDDKIIIDRLIPPQLQQQPDVFMQVTVPNEFQRVGKVNIGITAGIETTACAPQWIDGVNRMDLVIVPSEHAKQVFEQTRYTKHDKNTKQPVGELKVTTPIKVLFEGVDIDIFTKTNEIPKTIADQMDAVKEDFAFLFVGHWLQGNIGHDRKDVGGLIKAFCEAFKNTKNAPALILKTSSATFSVMDREETIRKINVVKDSVDAKTLPNIYLLHGDLEPEEINGLYNHPKVKTMVSFTKGEGYGRPLLEFTTSGKPVITTNWSGHLDFLDPKHNVLLPGKMQNVHPSAVVKDIILPDSQWFYVDYGYAIKILQDVFKDYNKYQKRAKGLAENTIKKFDIELMDEQFEKIVDEATASVPQQVTAKLPKLKKTGDGQKKVKLPTLKKVDAE